MNTRSNVRIWAEDVVVPTYLAGEPNRNPMFLEKRVYQGSSGRVYPYPVIDRISDQRVEESHPVVFLENDYLKLMVMPRFGGRIQYAYDKTNNYPFIYHNRVIKPALVGLAGPWLSGGIEFNWPQHHRPGTYCPVDYAIRCNPDGSMTLWLSEIEPMWHLKGTLGLTLHPGKALLEISIRLFNPTPLPQSFHLWTNPAVHVNDRYQSVFPPDVQAVYDHGKRDVSSFPIARGEYYKVDYSRGIDISWYKNLPVPTSYMAAKSDYDFVGGYDHGKQAGVLHVADHHAVPGKKQWVWGCGDFGQAWDRNLTDHDGPYAELMCGVFADNQPDFSWLKPFEEKSVRQFFLPYKAIGYVRNASIDAAVSLEIEKGKAKVGAYASSNRRQAVVRLSLQGRELWQKTTDLSPDKVLLAQVMLPQGTRAHDLELSVWSGDGRQLVVYSPEPAQEAAIPQPATPIPPPEQLTGNEALYLAGLHLEQYRHATREPEQYYREALRRDPGDLRSNNALGSLLLRRGQFAQAEPLFRAAIQTQTRHNPNPLDGEPHYNLGVCLRYLDRADEAYDAFYKAVWDAAWQDAAFLQLARIAAERGQLERALEFVEQALTRNSHNQKAWHLRVVLLRVLRRTAEAKQLAQEALTRDPLDFGSRNELRRIDDLGPGKGKRPRNRSERDRQTTGNETEMAGSLWEDFLSNPHSCLEIADSYAQAGFYGDAIQLLASAVNLGEIRQSSGAGSVRAPGHVGPVGMPNGFPLLYYFLGYYATRQGDHASAARYFKMAARQDPDRCFPNNPQSLLALQMGATQNPGDAHAFYYLGNLWYDKRQVAEAARCWEAARRANPRMPTVHRNLALVYFNKQERPAKALRSLERAFALDSSDARVLFELDLLKKRVRITPNRRFTFLCQHLPVVREREDLFLEYVTLLNFLGRHEEALSALLDRKFHPWEGGEGKVTGQYVLSLVEMAKRLLSRAGTSRRATADAASAEKAVLLLERAQHYPPNLGEGKLHGAQENHIFYWLGVAYHRIGRGASAKAAWEKAAAGLKTPTLAVYYNDQSPDMIFFQGLALKRLGRQVAARERFSTLVKFGQTHLKDHVEIDYFAVSLPEFMVFEDDLERRNEIHCRYLMGLGYLGLGRSTAARRQLRRVSELDPAHLGVRLHSGMFAWISG
jgi:tetratricopeptide (TPR) repeat protein